MGTVAAKNTLDVKGLRVALPDGRILIDSVDLAIAPGEVVVLLGGSGAGKSTFARVLFEREELDASSSRSATPRARTRAATRIPPPRGSSASGSIASSPIAARPRPSCRAARRSASPSRACSPAAASCCSSTSPPSASIRTACACSRA
ncbi:MAG: ATP-binding cassette domain-containing protein [Proteobacteria bacterium]|nr:ATP-binding cassette domain-containing protein [Pseudomonadota bacterium]